MSQLILQRKLDGRRFGLEVLAGITCASVIITSIFASLLLPLISLPLIFLAAALRWDFIFYAAVFLLPLSITIKSDLPVSDVSTIARLVLFAGIVFGNVVSQRPFLRDFWKPALNRCVLIYLAAIIVSTVFANPLSLASSKSLVHLFSYVAIYFAIREWATSEGRIYLVTNAVVASIIPVALFAFIQWITDGYTSFYFMLYPNQIQDLGPWDGRVTSFLNHPNSLAGYLCLALAVIAGLLMYRSDLRTRAGMLFAAICCVACLLLTQSRGGLVAAASILVLVITTSRQMRYRLATVAVLVVVVGLLITLIDRPQFQSLGYDPSLIGRAIIFAAAWQMFLHSPILGVGYGNFKQLFDSRVLNVAPGTFDVHNLYLQHLTESGVIGFFAFLLLIGTAIRLAYIHARHSRTITGQCVGFIVLAAIAATLVHGFVDFLFIVSPPFGSLFWILLALLSVADGLSRKAIAQEVL